jgi:hypothetical protein
MLSAFPCVPLPASIALRVESNQMRPSTSPSSATGRDLKSPDLSEIDALFQEAGLVRNLRGNSGAISHKQTDRLDRADAEELRRPAPPARVARNGVQWLAVPGWEKMSAKVPWLWHGYSTRKGGVSRAYCADDAPGELNLGFTPGDSREAVLRNRKREGFLVGGNLGGKENGGGFAPTGLHDGCHGNLLMVRSNNPRIMSEMQCRAAQGKVT